MPNKPTTSPLLIRAADALDIPSIKLIADETWPVAYGVILSKDQLTYMMEKMYSIHALEDQMQKGNHYLLALQNNRPVGFASFSPLENNIYKLQRLYVLPTQQKTGAGKALLDEVESVTKKLGADALWLNVNRHNPAKAFYERNNYHIIREENIDIGNGYFMNDYVMEKKL